ncbi:unnamed protein product [Prorocentrum cordatum]|uniref:Uncharacterized protein n=1 Tax=Prorocentrum cordatum TaxID=2364126 RepID=A0ABN9V005_9DINO|nr:unnamed protein product [Polarella glacialis]
MPLVIVAMPSLHTRLILLSFLYIIWGCARAELRESFRKWHASYLNFTSKPLVELWDHCHRLPLQLRYDMEPVRSLNLGLHVISFLCLGYLAVRMLVLARSPYVFMAYKAQDLVPGCFLKLSMIVTTCTYIHAPVLPLGLIHVILPLLVMLMPLATLKQSFVNRALLLDLANAVIATLGMVMLLAVNRFLNPSLVMLTPLEIQLQSFVIRVADPAGSHARRGCDAGDVHAARVAVQREVDGDSAEDLNPAADAHAAGDQQFPDPVSGDAHASGDKEWHADDRQGNLVTQSEARHHPAGAVLHVLLEDRDAHALPEPRVHALADASGADNHLFDMNLPPPRTATMSSAPATPLVTVNMLEDALAAWARELTPINGKSLLALSENMQKQTTSNYKQLFDTVREQIQLLTNLMNKDLESLGMRVAKMGNIHQPASKEFSDEQSANPPKQEKSDMHDVTTVTNAKFVEHFDSLLTNIRSAACVDLFNSLLDSYTDSLDFLPTTSSDKNYVSDSSSPRALSQGAARPGCR